MVTGSGIIFTGGRLRRKESQIRLRVLCPTSGSLDPDEIWRDLLELDGVRTPILEVLDCTSEGGYRRKEGKD